MDILQGNTIVFTDLHCGLAGNKASRLKICVNACKSIIKTAVQKKVQNIIFAGDWFHSRSLLDTNTINVSLKLVQALAKDRRLYLICGNHDSYFKNTTDVNSINIFRECDNVKVVDKTEEIALNGQKTLLVPWLGDVSAFKPGTFDILIGHFDISSKYLIRSYVEEHSAETAGASKAGDLVGNFVELAKKNGVVYAGHIHQHKEFLSKGREFIFVGSPYQQNLGEIGGLNGFYVLDSENRREFVETDGVPRHVQLIMSKRDSFDFGSLAGNIVQKVYDVDVDRDDDMEVSRRVASAAPYEELLPEYKVCLKNDGTPSSKSAELIRKSKLDYLRNYVDGMDGDDLAGKGLDRDKLFETLEKYYNIAAGA